MANIERRRKQRKLNLIIAAAGAFLLLCGIAALLIFLGKGKKGNGDVTVPTAGASAVPTDAAEITEAAVTAEPTEAITAEAPDITAIPATTEAATVPEAPIRISDEQSTVLLVMDCAKRYAADGQSYLAVSGSAAVAFVNNTDRTLYSAEFDIGEAQIVSVTLSGNPAKFTVENGLLTVPFVNELPLSDEVELFIEFTLEVKSGETFGLPEFTYDTSYLLHAYITSDAFLSFSGCRAGSENEEGRVLYTVDGSSVHSVRIGVRS